jgi:hypothetical protein
LREPFAIDECPIRTLDVFDVNLTPKPKYVHHGASNIASNPNPHLCTFLPNLSMLPTEHLAIEKAIPFGGDSLRIRLSSNLDAGVVKQGDVFVDEGIVQRVEVQRRVAHALHRKRF